MYTLKIHWTKHEAAKGQPLTLCDEATYFVPADRVITHGSILGADIDAAMEHWDPASYTNLLGVMYHDVPDVKGAIVYANGRLINVERDGRPEWFLASRAWLLGSDGRTIERVAP